MEDNKYYECTLREITQVMEDLNIDIKSYDNIIISGYVGSSIAFTSSETTDIYLNDYITDTSFLKDKKNMLIILNDTASNSIFNKCEEYIDTVVYLGFKAPYNFKSPIELSTMRRVNETRFMSDSVSTQYNVGDLYEEIIKAYFKDIKIDYAKGFDGDLVDATSGNYLHMFYSNEWESSRVHRLTNYFCVYEESFTPECIRRFARKTFNHTCHSTCMKIFIFKRK